MSIRVRHQLIVVASEVPSPDNNDEQLVHFEREITAVTQVRETAFDHEESGSFKIPASSNITLPLGSVSTVKILYIEADGDFELRLDGEGSGHDIKAKAMGVKRKAFLSCETTTAPVLVNASSTAAVVGSFLIAGDE